ncbi:EF-hand domain-containing protein [Syntrophobacter fumaroxidans]|uniref:EF-hand domain-containing protein n=1 Tax=Syntrophobacter fumaroxidans (strain DSM 10017 / MPOB) TaxID=335543 RepID=A0LEM7_SYNFM|nr:EF-hand domain-containing protein [Syntrophobacter fumaroxidans]ABK15879.1 hypothetical protein Sfum_0177 [Syntrophobacter fumaroxidans MPOB]
MTQIFSIVTYVLAVLLLTGCSSMGDSSPSQGVIEKVDMSRVEVLPTEDVMQGAKVRSFRSMDKDGDGAITWEEWQQEDTSQEAEARFDTLDGDKDAKIGYDEFIKSENSYVDSEDVYISLDRQKDGMLSRGEEKRLEGVKLFKIEF